MDVAEVNRSETVSMGKNWFFQSHSLSQFVHILEGGHNGAASRKAQTPAWSSGPRH